MKRVNISSLQFFTLSFLFLISNTIILGLDYQNGRDIWLVSLLAIGVGIGIFYFYFYLFSSNQFDSFPHLLQKGFGKGFSKVIGCLYILYFFYMGGLLLRDFSFFLGQTLFHSTPLWVISVTFILVVGYACYLGIEAIARSSEVLFIFHFCLFLFLITLGFLSPHFSFHHLFPVFQTPWHKILSSLFPRSITFPFGELMVLATLIPLVKEKDSLRKNGWFPILLAGLLLILSAEMVIGILQAELPKMYYFPFIKAVEALTFLEFFQRMEVVAVLLSITGGFIKLSLFFYGGWHVYTELFNKEENGKQVLVTCSLIFLLSFTFSHNIVIHFLIGFQVIPWIHVFFQFIVPLLLFTILRFRNPSSLST